MSTDSLIPWGFDHEWAALYPGEGERPGRVVRTHRVGFDVVTTTGREFCVHRAERRDPLRAPSTGDWVGVQDIVDEPDPVITSVMPRRTAVIRRDPADRAAPQVLATNTDVVGVVQGADRPINLRRLERFLAVAYGSTAEVVAIVTKTELNPDAVEELRDVLDGVTVLGTSAVTGHGIEAVDEVTDPRRTMVLLGESGAGKSTLVNAVVGHELLATGMVREGDAKGRHTTTRRELIALATGGALLDTPGIRSVGLWPGAVDLDRTFPRIAEAAEECKFRDCSHVGEPGCGVQAALASGTIEPDRYEGYQVLADELDATYEQLEQRDWR